MPLIVVGASAASLSSNSLLTPTRSVLLPRKKGCPHPNHYSDTNTTRQMAISNGIAVVLLCPHLEGGSPGKLLSPSRRRKIADHVCQVLAVSDRRACRVLGQARATQRRPDQVTDEELRLVARVIELATHYGRYGYRMITALLQREGWKVNHNRGGENLGEGRTETAKTGAAMDE